MTRADSRLAPEAQLLHERRQAVRALLMRPMLRAQGADAPAFGLVRVHCEWLREWFGRHLGWSLHVDTERARLGKIPAEPVEGTRPARDPDHRIPFTRSRYVLFCLALAGLEKGERQTTLGNLAREIGASVAAEPVFEASGIRFELTSRDCRRDLVHVILLLLDLGVIERIHGDEAQYLAERGDVLYTVHRPAIAVILNIRRGPSSIDAAALEDRIAALLEEPLPDTEEGWNRHLRTTLARKLVDDPVTYHSELEPGLKAYLFSQRAFLLKHIEEGTGLIPEIRAEGIALVDEDGELSDIGMPCEGTEGHFTLLLASELARRDSESAGGQVGLAELETFSRRLIERFGQYWRKDSRHAGAVAPLLADALERLEALKLIRRVPGPDGGCEAVLPLPAIARYSVAEPETPESNDDQILIPEENP